MPKRLHKSFLLLSALTVFSLFSCHTRPHFSAGKAYRNLTAYYNTYFNAKEIYNLAIKKINLANPDRYDRLLSFYKLGDDASAAGLAGEMDQVIKKCSALILGHDRSDWVDDSYLLMGKAYYLKGDYYHSLENFQYIYNTFSNDTMKVAALVWSARTYIQQEKLDEAQQSLDLAFSSPNKAIRKNSDELYTTAARFYLEKKDTVKSAAMVRMALDSGRARSLKARYCFLLAQLDAAQGNSAASRTWFAKVLDYSPAYDLAFGAKLGIAESAGSSELIQASLARLMKDENSIDFHDQILYALGRLSQRSKRYTEALHLYQLSLQNNTSNANQRGLDYLRMGEIYLTGIKDYRKASLYQDSCMAYLDKSYPGYARLKTRQEKLGALVQNYKLIDQGDTLLMLASLSEAAMKSRASAIVQAEIAKRNAAEKAAIDAYKRQLAAASAQFANVSSQGSLIGSALSRPQVASNSFLSTTGSYSSAALSSYQPSAANQLQIYGQGAATGISGSQYGGGGGSSSSGSGSYSSYGGGSSGGYGNAGGFSQPGSTSVNGFGAASGGGFAGSSGAAGSVPVYGGQSPVYNQQQTAYAPANGAAGVPGSSYSNSGYTNPGNQSANAGPQSAASTPSGGAGLYGGQSYNPVSQGGGGGNLPGPAGIGTPSPNGLQNGNMPSPGYAQDATQNPGSPGTFVANTASINSPNSQPGVVYGNGAQNGAAYQQALPQNGPALPPAVQQAIAGAAQGQSNYGQGQANYGSQGAYAQTPPAYNGGAYPTGNTSFGNSSGQTSSFYFANPQAMSMGFTQFLQKWGNRPLRDNWRRSSRLDGATDGAAPDSARQLKQNTLVLESIAEDPAPAIRLLLSLVPHTAGAKDTLFSNLFVAYGSNAAIYQADLNDVPMAIKTYEEALDRFPNDSRDASFTYELYKLNIQTGNTGKAAENRAFILSHFPNSIYATAFLHPEELEPKPQTDSVLEKYYAESYEGYTRHEYARVIDRAKTIPQVAIGNYLADKFELLRVLSIGNTRRLENFEPELRRFSTSYAGKPLASVADELLKKIDSNRAEYAGRNPVLSSAYGEDGFEMAVRRADQKDRAERAERERLRLERKRYFFNDLTGPYHFLILFSQKSVNMRPIRLNLSQFEAAEFGNLHLQNAIISSAAGKLALQAGPFKDLKTGLAWYRAFDERRSDLISLAPASYEYYLISDANEAKLLGLEQLQIYREFFQDEIQPFLLGRPLPESNTKLAASKSESAGAANKKPAVFSAAPEGNWLVVLVIKDQHTGLNPTRLQISLFNQQNFAALKLHHSSRLLGSEAQMVSVNSFNGLEPARQYLVKLKTALGEVAPFGPEKLETVLISTANYNKLQSLSDLDSYRLFFDKQFKTH